MVQPVSYWVDKFPLTAALARKSEQEADLLVKPGDAGFDSDKASHAMYRSAYLFYDGLVAMWRATDDNTTYLNPALDWVEYCINNVHSTSGLAFSDSYDSWWGNAAGQEHSLREAYLWRYVTIMLREMKAHPTLLGTSNYQARYDAILAFTELNIWTKWRNRTSFSGTTGDTWWQFCRDRTHMTSHWGHIAMNLEIIALSPTIRSEANIFLHAFTANGMTMADPGWEAYNKSLKGQLTYPHPNSPNGVTWSNRWGYTWNANGTNWGNTDGDHAAAEVGFMCEAFDFGHDITQSEIDALCALMNEYYWTSSAAAAHQYPPTWVTGSSGAYPASSADLFTDGFIKLGRYNTQIQDNLEAYEAAGSTGFGQLEGNAALNALILEGGTWPPPQGNGGSPSVPLNIIHSEAKHGGQTKTIPLSTYQGSGRKALVIASWQGQGHGETNMGATPAPFTELLRQPWHAGVQPSVLVWWADITSASDVALPISHQGCGWALWVLEGVDSFTVTDDGGGFGSSYAVNGLGDDLTMAGVSTNSTVTVTPSGGLTAVSPGATWWSEVVGGHALPGVNGSFSWTDQDWAGVTVKATETTQSFNYTNAADSIITGSQQGAGLGTDVTSTDQNGITTAPSTVLEVVDGWTVTPAGPSSAAGFRASIKLPSNYTPSNEGYAVTYQIEDSDSTIVVAETTFPPESGSDAGIAAGETRIFNTGPLSNLTWGPPGGASPQVRIKLTPTLLSTLRPAGGGGAVYGTWFGVDVPDWWELGATNDRFNIRARANGPVEYAHTGGSGDGSQGSPWSVSQLASRLNGRQFPANTLVNLAAGNYIGLGQISGGGSGSSGWVTLLGPSNPATPAIIQGNFDRGWSIKGGGGRIQFVRLHADQTALNAAFNSYVDGAGSAYDDDTQGLSALGSNPGVLGFQLDGDSTPVPGPYVAVNCVATGCGEGFGSYQAGHMFGVGCVSYENAYASPFARSSGSLSWSGGGSGNTADVEPLFNIDDGTPVFGGWFGCIFARAFQLIPSRALGDPDNLTDGNGLISPTDGPNETGKILNQCNITFANSGAGLTGFNWHTAGGKVVNCTSFGNGANTQHRNGTSPFYRPGTATPLATGLAAAATSGAGPAILMQRYTGNASVAEIAGCIALGNAWDSRSVQFWGSSMVAAGRGNIFTSSPAIDAGASGSVSYTLASEANVLTNPDVTGLTDSVDPSPKPGSPAIGAAFLSDLDINLDFHGNPYVERTTGRIDAGAIQS